MKQNAFLGLAGLVLGVTLLASGCDKNPVISQRNINPSHSVRDNIEYWIRTDKQAYIQGEDSMQVCYSITNLADKRREICEVVDVEYAKCDFSVEKEAGGQIWRNFYDIPDSDFVKLYLNPNETKEFCVIWNLRNDNGTSYPEDDFPADTGTYLVKGALREYNGLERVGLEIPIHIIE